MWGRPVARQRVVDKLDASQGVSARENAALVLGSIARSTVSPLTYSLGAPCARPGPHAESRTPVRLPLYEWGSLKPVL